MSDKTNVACKLPSGLTIELGGSQVLLNGSHASGAVLGYGITRGVDADAFDKWLKEDAKDFAAVKIGAIFAYKGDDIAAAVRERAKEVRSGFEGIDPNKPGDDIEPTDEMKRELAKIEAGEDDQ